MQTKPFSLKTVGGRIRLPLKRVYRLHEIQSGDRRSKKVIVMGSNAILLDRTLILN
ncbi:MAG: hypothetical protein HWQ23_07445 [Nostoc sp. JL33]|uniref:hypothetical protein n=1 Tax=Nostoc sp. JL33 TaxID=2815396 RepID=UPI0025EA10D7|nr:hypothetical protein [Nostoc sp. JL33]MBN3870130.1 hypothetical protein [Nostoc sp. JL33]